MTKNFKLEDLLNDSSMAWNDVEEREINKADTPALELPEDGPQQIDPVIPDYILNDPEIVGYPDVQMQQEIYQWVYASMYTDVFQSKSFIVKDFGCGRGDFGGWLGLSDYIGIDRLPVMIDAGKEKYPGLKLICDDWMYVSITSDYTVCIGSLNQRDGLMDHYDRFWQTFGQAMRSTTKKIIFVFSVGEEEGDGELVSYDLSRIIDAIPKDFPFEIDCSRFQGVCKLVVHCQRFQ